MNCFEIIMVWYCLCHLIYLYNMDSKTCHFYFQTDSGERNVVRITNYKSDDAFQFFVRVDHLQWCADQIAEGIKEILNEALENREMPETFRTKNSPVK